MFFSEISCVAYQIKGNETENTSTMQTNILPFKHPTVPERGPRVTRFSEGHVAYQNKERSVEHYASKIFDHMHTFDLLGWVKKSDINI